MLVLIALFTGVTYILQQFWLSNYHSHLEQIVGFNICLFVDIGFVYENKGRFRSMVVVLDVSDTYASILLDIVSWLGSVSKWPAFLHTWYREGWDLLDIGPLSGISSCQEYFYVCSCWKASNLWRSLPKVVYLFGPLHNTLSCVNLVIILFLFPSRLRGTVSQYLDVATLHISVLF